MSHWDENHTEPMLVSILHEARASWSEMKANFAFILKEYWLLSLVLIMLFVMTGVCVYQGETIRYQRDIIKDLSEPVSPTPTSQT